MLLWPLYDPTPFGTPANPGVLLNALSGALQLRGLAMKNLGDYAAGTPIFGKFSTFRPSTGAAFTLAGSPALSVYKDASTTQSAAGVTLTVDFDGVVGFHHFTIDTSADAAFYSAGSNFDVVITAGTVDGVSIAGAVVASFTIEDTFSSGLPLLRRNTATAATASTITLDAGASAVDGFYNGCFVTAQGQTLQVVGYVGATKVATIYIAGPPVQGRQWPTTPSGAGLAYRLHGFAITPLPVSMVGTRVAAHVEAIAGEVLQGAGTGPDPWRPV
jgi:hypothetical protein